MPQFACSILLRHETPSVVNSTARVGSDSICAAGHGRPRPSRPRTPVGTLIAVYHFTYVAKTDLDGALRSSDRRCLGDRRVRSPHRRLACLLVTDFVLNALEQAIYDQRGARILETDQDPVQRSSSVHGCSVNAVNDLHNHHRDCFPAVYSSIDTWSLTSLQQRLVKTGGRLVTHARYYWLLLAESHLTRRLFGSMLQRIWALPVPAG